MYHIGLQTLRAKIRGFYAAGSTVSRHISRSEKDRRHRLWQLKREIGDHCRHHLIAYGYLRGIPYDRIETCSERNRPCPHRLAALVNEHGDTRQKATHELLLAFMQGTTRARACVLAVLTPVSSQPSSTAPTMAQEKPEKG